MANVSVKRSGQGGFTIEVSGAPNIDEKIVQGCINEAIQCGCLSNGIHFQAKCLEVIRRHEEESRCVSSCFGCA